MKRLSLMILIVCLMPQMAQAETNSISRMQQAQASIVAIRTVFMKPLRADNRMVMVSYERHGAGVIIDSSGIIVTNTHIVMHAPRILVALSTGKVYEAKPIWIGPGDFSLLKIDVPFKLRPIPWAESSKARLGEQIMAYGRSDQNSETILGGNVTGLINSSTSGMTELIELNLNLYKGDSGGPILNTQGELLGLVMGKEKSEDRRSFAIASDKIRQEYLKYKQKMQ